LLFILSGVAFLFKLLSVEVPFFGAALDFLPFSAGATSSDYSIAPFVIDPAASDSFLALLL